MFTYRINGTHFLTVPFWKATIELHSILKELQKPSDFLTSHLANHCMKWVTMYDYRLMKSYRNCWTQSSKSDIGMVWRTGGFQSCLSIRQALLMPSKPTGGFLGESGACEMLYRVSSYNKLSTCIKPAEAATAKVSAMEPCSSSSILKKSEQSQRQLKYHKMCTHFKCLL